MSLLHTLKHAVHTSREAFIALSTLMFFFSAAVSLTIYIDSSFLTETITKNPRLMSLPFWSNADNVVGTLYTFASLLTILILIVAPRLLSRYGNYRWTLGILCVHTFLLLGLALSDSLWLIIPLFVFETAFISVLYYNFDIFLERYSRKNETGTVRGLFMVIGSIAWLFPPLLAGWIAQTYGFAYVYFTAAILIVPIILFLIRYFSDFQDLTYDHQTFAESRKRALTDPNIRNILAATFLMHCFYAWMIIYTPIYLHQKLGMSFTDIGLLLTVALSAFVIFPYPLGRIADKWLGEKELLIAGFILMAISTAALPLLADSGAGLFLWGAVLFFGRTGAATVETMAESFFFKEIDGTEASEIGEFRRMRPTAFIVAPLLASALLQFNIIEIRELFYVLAALMIIALYFVFGLRDTK